jgi:hypothetical protein
LGAKSDGDGNFRARPIAEDLMKKYFLIFFLCLVPYSAWAQPPEVKPEQILTLVFSSNIYGEYEPFG